MRRPPDRAGAIPIERTPTITIRKSRAREGVFRLHPRLLRSGFALTITCWSAFWTLLLDCPCPAAGRPCRPTNFPVRPRGQPRPGWTEKNVIRIPPRSEYISPSRLDVHCCRSGPRKPCAWELAYGQDMLPGWQQCVKVATLYGVRDRPAVDLKTESYIPSKGRLPDND